MSSHRRDIDGLEERAARRIIVNGRVQGVGFRPFVFRSASQHGLKGWVRNGSGRVLIHVEGDARDIARFESKLIEKAPPLAEPHLEASDEAIVEGARDFRIQASDEADAPDVHLPPDMFCCDDCIRELSEPSQRRFRYPFTNCTQCGPRYTIIKALPYDRPHTSMAGFRLCPRCQAEFDDPLDRRFHAQPLACPDCGPRVAFHRGGREPCLGEAAMSAAIACLHDGGIVAVKGVGGYHLLCDASDDDAVAALRTRKHRPDKPLAVMFPQKGADGLDAVRDCVTLGDAEAYACADPRRPIVLARRLATCRLSKAVAPGLAELGVFLPYSPLHHLLLTAFGAPLVATSGNVSAEPVITNDEEATARLSRVADAFLHHDRPIVRPADDPVVRVIDGRSRPMRIGRGMAPLEVELPCELSEPTLAVGGHMKGAVALGWGRRAVVSPHIGELDSPRSLQVFAQVIADLQALYRVEARRIVCDPHPSYASTRWATSRGLPVAQVQHHIAHASALAADYPDTERWLVFAWDGIGLGDDGDLWGGEALAGAPGAWRRVASMRRFRVVGGDRVGREPWRSAAALMWETGRPWSPCGDDGELALQAWRRGVATSQTSSVGRLFDAAASLVLGVDVASFEGQGPMMLESIAATDADAVALPLARDCYGIWRTDWEPLLSVLADRSLTVEARAGIFHESMARALVDQAMTLADEKECVQGIGLTGGVFQNRLLAERAITLLAERGFAARLPRTVPANDGGLAFGQLLEALHLDPAPDAYQDTGR
jgi:hydrogenase maturation protein HypF